MITTEGRILPDSRLKLIPRCRLTRNIDGKMRFQRLQFQPPPKKRLPEGWLLSTSGSAPRLEAVVLEVGESDGWNRRPLTSQFITLQFRAVNRNNSSGNELIHVW